MVHLLLVASVVDVADLARSVGHLAGLLPLVVSSRVTHLRSARCNHTGGLCRGWGVVETVGLRVHVTSQSSHRAHLTQSLVARDVTQLWGRCGSNRCYGAPWHATRVGRLLRALVDGLTRSRVTRQHAVRSVRCRGRRLEGAVRVPGTGTQVADLRSFVGVGVVRGHGRCLQCNVAHVGVVLHGQLLAAGVLSIDLCTRASNAGHVGHVLISGNTGYNGRGYLNHAQPIGGGLTIGGKTTTAHNGPWDGA